MTTLTPLFFAAQGSRASSRAAGSGPMARDLDPEQSCRSTGSRAPGRCRASAPRSARGCVSRRNEHGRVELSIPPLSLSVRVAELAGERVFQIAGQIVSASARANATPRPCSMEVSHVMGCGPPTTASAPRLRAYAARSSARCSWWLWTPTSATSVRSPPRIEAPQVRQIGFDVFVDRFHLARPPRDFPRGHAREIGNRAVRHEAAANRSTKPSGRTCSA